MKLKHPLIVTVIIALLLMSCHGIKSSLKGNPHLIGGLKLESLPEGAFRTVLPNGLEAFFLPSKRVPLVTAVIVARNGSFAQTAEYSGLAHLYEHMFFKANKRVGSQEAFLDRLKELGVKLGPEVNASTAQEAVLYRITLQSNRLAEGLSFMADAVIDPLFLEDELNRERKVILSEIDNSDSYPAIAFYRRTERELFSRYPFRKDPWGRREVVASATPEKMRFIRDTYYVAGNCAVIISGNFELAKAVDLVTKDFGRWEKGSNPFERFPIPEHPRLPGTKVFILNQPVRTPQVVVAYQGARFTPGSRHNDAADVLSTMLSSSYSRFQKTLVDSGMALSAGFSSSTRRYTSTDEFSLETTVDRLIPALDLLFSEIRTLRKPGYFSDDELVWAKDGLQVQTSLSREGSLDRAVAFGSMWPLLGIDYYFNYASSVASIERSDLEEYIATFIERSPHVIGLMISKEDQTKLKITPELLRRKDHTR